jgi:hypothetical protein
MSTWYALFAIREHIIAHLTIIHSRMTLRLAQEMSWDIFAMIDPSKMTLKAQVASAHPSPHQYPAVWAPCWCCDRSFRVLQCHIPILLYPLKPSGAKL